MFPLELPEVEELSTHFDHGRVEFPAVDDGFGVELEEDAGGGAGAEAEDGEGSRRDDGWEGGEDVEVGVGEGFEEERDAVDVSGTVEEEKPGTSEWVVGFSRNFENADVVVS